MRLSWALLSVWTSTSNRRYSFCYGFASWTRYKRSSISHYTSISTNIRQQVTMDSNQSKRPRKEDPNETSLAMKYSPTEELQHRSPYERKMGKIISTCYKCRGYGKVRAPLSKKARAMRKQMQQQDLMASSAGGTTPNNDTPPAQPPMKPCRVCDGSGLIASVPSSGSTIEKEEETKSEPPGRNSPQIMHPGISVAIVGGGIGGIALAAALQHRNIPCVVYERDMSFEERKQGYGLTMQQGARALRSLGFFSFSENDSDDDSAKNNAESNDETAKEVRFGIHSTRHVVHKPDGTVVGEWGMKVWGGRFEKNNRKHAKRQNAHISRQNLRKLLMGMLLPGTIQWGHQLVGYSERSTETGGDDSDENSHLNLTFRRRRLECQGTEEECEEVVTTSATLLVGCDGIRSAVRANKLGENVAPLRYLDCIVILGIAPSPDSALTDGETVFQTADGVTRLYAMPFAQAGEEGSDIADILDEDNIGRGLSMWQLSFPMAESDAKKLSQLGPSALKAEALKRCNGWHNPIPTLLSQTPEELITGYPCYDRALVEKAVFRDGCSVPDTAAGHPFVTMLGDAAHPMSPFKGQGANQALLDAILLARKLYGTLRIDSRKPKDQEVSIKSRIPTALAEFEEEMLERSSVKVKKSADAAKFLHTHVAISEGNVTRGAAAVEDAAHASES